MSAPNKGGLTPTPSTPGNGSPRPANRTWMPATAGVLAIVAGVLCFFTGLLVGTVLSAIGSIVGFPRAGALAIPLLVFGIVAVVGGVFAIMRKAWPMALTGAICALMWPYTLLGILSIVFVSIAKSEFK
jgi:hypothetical protein